MGAPYTWVQFPEAKHDALRIEIAPLTEEGFHYWALQYNLAGTPAGGYIGLQTVGARLGVKAVNFSQWRSWAGGAGEIPGAISASFAGEGEGWQTIAPLAWVPAEPTVLELYLDRRAKRISAYADGRLIGWAATPTEPEYETTGAFGSGAVCWTERYGGTEPTAEGLFMRLRAGRSRALRKRLWVPPDHWAHAPTGDSECGDMGTLEAGRPIGFWQRNPAA